MSLLLLFGGGGYTPAGLVCVTTTGSAPGDSAASTRPAARFSATGAGGGFSAGKPGDSLSGARPDATFSTQECN